MDMYDIILKKRLGKSLSKDEIQYFIAAYTKGEIPDYQASALLMAIMFQRLDMDETVWLTEAMRDSGDKVDLTAIHGIKVDKHSTGGVGDKTTLILGPLVAACGVPIAKMSGRGLGFTGGTVDKMESVPGMRTSMEPGELIRQVNEIGLAVIGQTAHIAPADKKLYALRDVTATIDNLSLISASIMSKKLAAGADAILLDVKCGSGAFVQTVEEASALGEMMVSIGRNSGKNTVAVITDMSQPLGLAVGNSLEVLESIDTLKGRGPADITALTLSLAGIMVYLGGKAASPEAGAETAKHALESGLGLKKFREFVKAQGGNPEVSENPELFPQPAHRMDILAPADGYVASIEANKIGQSSRHTGAGRNVIGETLDLSAGILLKKKVGDPVTRGEILAILQGDDEQKLQNAAPECLGAFVLSPEKPEPCKLIHRIIGI